MYIFKVWRHSWLLTLDYYYILANWYVHQWMWLAEKCFSGCDWLKSVDLGWLVFLYSQNAILELCPNQRLAVLWMNCADMVWLIMLVDGHIFLLSHGAIILSFSLELDNHVLLFFVFVHQFVKSLNIVSVDVYIIYSFKKREVKCSKSTNSCCCLLFCCCWFEGRP